MHLADVGKNGHDEDDDGASCIQHHDQAAAILAINNDTSERQHEHRGNGLQYGKRT